MDADKQSAYNSLYCAIKEISVVRVRATVAQALKLRNGQKNNVAILRKGHCVRITGFDNGISAACFSILSKGKENIAKSADGLSVAINTEITPELKSEGMYREILRHCQLLRKEAGFAVSDRVLLSFDTASESIQTTIKSYALDIARETLSEICEISISIISKEIKLDDGAVLLNIPKS